MYQRTSPRKRIRETIQKLIRKPKETQQKFRDLQNIEAEKSNKWISFTYTGIKTARISKLFKKVDRNIKISFKTNTKLNNIIENFNIYDWKGVYKLTCVNCDTLYIEGTTGN